MTVETQALRLLIVEDHSDTAELLSSLLELRGHDVQIAGNVEEALRLAAERRFDLVVSDVGLPDATGYDLMRELRVREPVIRGIAMSGWGRPEDIARSREAGFAEHLIKPVRLERLQEAIARAIASPTG